MKNFPIHSLKLIYQWNILTLFNLIKAEKNFLNSNITYITTQILDKNNLVYYLKNGFITFLQNHIDIKTLYLPKEFFYIKFTKKIIENTKFSEIEISNLIKNILKRKEIYFQVNNKSKVFLLLEKLELDFLKKFKKL